MQEIEQQGLTRHELRQLKTRKLKAEDMKKKTGEDGSCPICFGEFTSGDQVRDLEKHLGAPLFSRSGRGVTLTEEGERYLEPLRAGFQLIRSASLGGDSSSVCMLSNITMR